MEMIYQSDLLAVQYSDAFKQIMLTCSGSITSRDLKNCYRRALVFAKKRKVKHWLFDFSKNYQLSENENTMKKKRKAFVRFSTLSSSLSILFLSAFVCSNCSMSFFNVQKRKSYQLSSSIFQNRLTSISSDDIFPLFIKS